VGNQYSSQMIKAYAELGLENILWKSWWDLIVQNLFYRSHTICHLNWFESQLINKKGNLSFRGFVSFFIKYCILKACCKKLIFVRHNLYPHYTSTKNASKVKKIIDFLEKYLFDFAIVHSSEYSNKKRIYIPHPLYQIDNEKPEESIFRLVNEIDSYAIVFGRIKRYKSIDKLVKSWNCDFNLIIAGECDEKDYLQEIENIKGEKNNIFLIPKRISDGDAAYLVKNSLCSIIPTDGDQIIVSGSMYFSFSCYKPCITVNMSHAKNLEKAGFCGVINVSNHSDINGKIKMISSINFRDEIDKNFGIDVISQSIKEKVLDKI
jgi:glycosyltransferase involved in cell wall biosynthesis